MSRLSLMIMATAAAFVLLAGNAQAFQTAQQRDTSDQDQQLRSQIEQRQRERSLKQRLGNESSYRRAQDAAERANEEARRARQRALGR